jgi:hypothetical protein
MKVIVDYDICASTGACTQIAPEVFEVRRHVPHRCHHHRGLTLVVLLTSFSTLEGSQFSLVRWA